MKRVLVFLILLLAVVMGVLYAGISTVQSFSKSVLIGCTSEGAFRVLANKRSSKQGWPGEKLNDSTYNFEQLQYTVGNFFINTIALRFSETGKAELIADETMPDSVRFTINHTQKLPLNPLGRIKAYLDLKKTQQKVDALLAAFKQKIDGEELVYGIKINMNRVTDTAMISTRKLINHYPSVSEVYEMIDAIRAYIKTNGGEESNAPMLHVYEESAGKFYVMVAVPTKTVINGTETFLQKRMLANGYILASEVTGGDATIQKGEAAMKQYVEDHQKSSPAIPFQMLMTDRRSEPDTTKWKTRLYYPVMY
jgi:hypothetical protein